jgi:Fic family protein
MLCPASRAPDRPIPQLLDRIRSEYLEIPGLRLTDAQAERLWHVDEVTAKAAFAALVEVGFLRRTHHGAFVVADAR